MRRRPRSSPRNSPRSRLLVLLAALCVGGITAASLTACSDTPDPKYYVSIGDSYAAGYQPTGPDSGQTTTNGFAYRIAEQQNLTLANFGCSGQTAVAMARTPGCQRAALGPGATPYSDPQLTAATTFIRDHAERIGLVTIVLGGNDLLGCVTSPIPQQCAEEATPRIIAILDGTLSSIRDAVGPTVPIVGLTYANPYLGGLRTGTPEATQQAERMQTLLTDYLNPALTKSLDRVDGSFANVTDLAGAYLPDTEKIHVDPYGSLPASIARACQLTFYCQYGDVHLQPAGHELVARAVTSAATGEDDHDN